MIEIHADILYSDAVETAIANLITHYAGRPKSSWDNNDEAEYDALFAFRAAVLREYGADAWRRGISFIADDYRAKYAADIANERYGEATAYVAWSDDVHEEEYYRDYKSFGLDDQEYWSDGTR